MSTYTFEEAPNPDAVLDVDAETGSDLSCEVCGKSLTYAGRGRKPTRCEEHKRGTRASKTGTVNRSRADVDQALSTLDGMYTGVSLGLMTIGSARGLAKWEAQRPYLIEQDRGILIADKALCRRINDFASAGGTAAFIFAQIAAVVPVALIVRDDIAVRRRARTSAQAQAEQEQEAAAAARETFGAGAEFM